MADVLRASIQTIIEGKKAWCGFVPPIRTIKLKKRAPSETTANKTSKRQQLLSKHNPGWMDGELSQWEEIQTTRSKEPVEFASEKMAKPIKIKLRQQDKDTTDLVQRVNPETIEEEAEEEPAETLQRRPRKRDTEQ